MIIVNVMSTATVEEVAAHIFEDADTIAAMKVAVAEMNAGFVVVLRRAPYFGLDQAFDDRKVGSA